MEVSEAHHNIHPLAGDLIKNATPLMFGIWTIGFVVSLFLTVPICLLLCRHRIAARREVAMSMHPNSMNFPVKRTLVMRIIGIIPVFIWCSYLGMFLIRGFIVLQFVMGAYESLTLLWFFSLILELCGGPAVAAEHLRRKIPRGRLMCAPPCCWVGLLAGKMEFSVNLLKVCYYLTLQYSIVKPFLVVCESFATNQGWYTEGSLKNRPNFWPYMKALDIVSMLCCMYALFIMYRGTKGWIGRHRIGLKFGMIKGIIFLFSLSSTVCTTLGKRHVFGDSETLPAETRGVIARQCVSLLAMIPFSVIALAAFPVDEFRPGSGVIDEEMLFDTKVDDDRDEYLGSPKPLFGKDAPYHSLAAGDTKSNHESTPAV